MNSLSIFPTWNEPNSFDKAKYTEDTRPFSAQTRMRKSVREAMLSAMWEGVLRSMGGVRCEKEAAVSGELGCTPSIRNTPFTLA